MNARTSKLLAAAALLIATLVPNLHAAPLTLNSPGVVGIYDGKLANANVATEIVAAQHLLSMLAGQHEGAFDASDGLYLWQTSSTEYSATLTGGLQTNTGVSGYEYGFAKYDGQNAGYVLFYLGGALASTLIPNTPDNLWTTSGQYALSHLTVFNASPNRVADGGTTAVLLGSALIGMSLVARRRRVA